MTTLETTTIVPDDRRLVVQLPDDVLPGEHRVRVEIDPPLNAGSPQDEPTPVKWDGNVLVYGGDCKFTGDPQQLIDQDREERMRHIWSGLTP